MIRRYTILIILLFIICSISAQNKIDLTHYSFATFSADSIGFEEAQFFSGNLYLRNNEPLQNLKIKFDERSQGLFVKVENVIYEINPGIADKFEIEDKSNWKTYERGFTLDEDFEYKIPMTIKFKTEQLSNQQLTLLTTWMFSFEDVEINIINFSGKKNKLRGHISASFQGIGVFNRYVKELNQRQEIKEANVLGNFYEAQEIVREKSSMLEISEFTFLEVLVQGNFKFLKGYRYLDVVTSGPLNSLKSVDQRSIREYFITNGKKLTPVKLSVKEVMNYVEKNIDLTKNLLVTEAKGDKESEIIKILAKINAEL